MSRIEEVQKLAALARIEVAESELAGLAGEFDAILAYVGQLTELALPEGSVAVLPLKNVFREDEAPHASGTYTECLAAQFPAREGDALVVKQVITHDAAQTIS